MNLVLELQDLNRITLGLVLTLDYLATPLTLLFTTIGITVNERVYDLAFEVLKDYPVIESWTFSRLELAKFAELIVQDCVDKIASVPNAYGDYRDQIEDVMREYCIYSIKQHFGLEQDRLNAEMAETMADLKRHGLIDDETK